MMENRPDSLKMLDWETQKGQKNLEEKERIVLTRLIKETVPKALGEDVSFENLWLLYMLNYKDSSLKQSDLVDEILENIELQLGEDAETDESNIIFVLVMIYESFDKKGSEIFEPQPDSKIEKVTI